ncbi:MAG: aldehyde dehydrogenase family protein [Pseudoxanthomonas sp.]
MHYPDTSHLLARNAPLIGERWAADASAGTREHIDPNRAEAIAEVRIAGAREVDEAVAVAARAQQAWMALSPPRRREIMQAWLQRIRDADSDLRLLAALESGIPVGVDSSPLAHAWIDYYAGWTDRIEGATTEGSPTPGFNYTRKEPYGVVGVIIPWNGPMVAIAMTCAPALAAGNAVVLKPPSNTPFVALKLGELALEAGFPPGLFNVLPGDAEAGQALAAHAGVGKVCFTGGGEIAQHVLKAAATTLKPVFLELGGKSPNLLFDDADLDNALPVSLFSCMTLAGQGCVLPTRLLVQRGVYDQVIERLQAMQPMLVTGLAYDPQNIVGPVISDAARTRILGMIERARATGEGRVLFGGRKLEGENLPGYFVEPTVFADVAPSASIAREEVFRPGADSDPVRYRERSHRHRQRQLLRAGRLCANPRPGAWPARGHASAGRLHHRQQLPDDEPERTVWRLQAQRLWPPWRARGPGGISANQEHLRGAAALRQRAWKRLTSSSSVPVRPVVSWPNASVPIRAPACC